MEADIFQRTWFTGTVSAEARDVLLICPHGGAGPSAYAGWRTLASETTSVATLHLPGRERRMSDPPRPLAEQDFRMAVDEVLQLTHERQRLVIFGHSLGALVAFEMAHRLERVGRAVSHLVVSAHAAPAERLDPTRPSLADLSDRDLTEWVVGLGGVEPSFLGPGGLLELFLPVLRADLVTEHCHVADSGRMVDCPILVLWPSDDPTVTRAAMERWGNRSGETRFVVVRGGHFYETGVRDVLPYVADLLSASQGGHS